MLCKISKKPVDKLNYLQTNNSLQNLTMTFDECEKPRRILQFVDGFNSTMNMGNLKKN